MIVMEEHIEKLIGPKFVRSLAADAALARQQLQKEYSRLRSSFQRDLQELGAFADPAIQAKHHNLKCETGVLI